MSADQKSWVKYDPLTHSYQAPGGPKVRAEFVDDLVDLEGKLRLRQWAQKPVAKSTKEQP